MAVYNEAGGHELLLHLFITSKCYWCLATVAMAQHGAKMQAYRENRCMPKEQGELLLHR